MKRKGFTLIELLIVIGVLGILATIILVAVDPAKRLRQARNARRYSESNAILNAILNYTVDHRGTLPEVIRSATISLPFVIGTTASESLATTVCPASATGLGTAATATRNLGGDTALVDEYISEIPVDPRGVNENGDAYSSAVTGYYFARSLNGRVQVGSCNPESEDNITTPVIYIQR